MIAEAIPSGRLCRDRHGGQRLYFEGLQQLLL